MKLTKAKGNMYDWVSHTFSHIGGECPHKCSYCYVQAMAKRFPQMKAKYSGNPYIINGSLDVNFGSNKTIFIDHLNDLWAESIPDFFIVDVLEHCNCYPENQYVFQTKNPWRYQFFKHLIPKGSILGTTMESDIDFNISQACDINHRIVGIRRVKILGFETFITIEPILQFTNDFVFDIIYASPVFVNIGADSKGHGLHEPTYSEVMQLYKELQNARIEVRKKINLERLKTTNSNRRRG